MNDHEILEQRVDKLRLKLQALNQKEEVLRSIKKDLMDELFDTRRQLAREDIRIKSRPQMIVDNIPPEIT